MTIELFLGDCLEVLPTLTGPVDAIITDLPYGTTACKWDSVIPFAPMWAQVKRLLKPRGAFVTTASQPFTSALIMSNLAWFKYCWVWDKHISTGFAFAKWQPMRAHEDIIVFSGGSEIYNPQFTKRTPEQLKRFCYTKPAPRSGGDHYPEMISTGPTREGNKERFPDSVVRILGVNGRSGEKVAHPTQKPVALYEYLIRTYTNEGETVLDFCMGSCTTGVACLNTKRNFIGIEKDAAYFAIAERRIQEAQAQGVLL